MAACRALMAPHVFTSIQPSSACSNYRIVSPLAGMHCTSRDQRLKNRVPLPNIVATTAPTRVARRWRAPSTADKSGGSADRGFISYADGEKLVIADHRGPGMIFWLYWTHDASHIKFDV